ncbi:hypothetical protein LCGC14_1218940 [marine sediment metagenome]|uniref:HNH nuclease domain-containing protein n=1 Tax=marine sediment metagenome TaxID=412755 RepID=A0A0F9LBX9_9ZZZZ
MTEVGTIKYGKDIGQLTCPKIKFVWLACRHCGKERWVRLYLAKKKQSNICRHCNQKGKQLIRNGNHYIEVRLRPNDFFYPMARKAGLVKEHRLVMAKHLGRNLHRWEIVHHKNHIKDDNRIENLQLVMEGQHRQITIMQCRITELEEKLASQVNSIRLLQWQIKELNKVPLKR